MISRLGHRHRPLVAAGATQRGVTLVELMVTISIAVILLGIGVPTFREITLISKLRSYANHLETSAMLARSEALKRNVAVSMCVSTTGTGCTPAANWEDGWIIIAGATVIQRQTAMTGGYAITEAGGSKNIVFQPTGVGATFASLKVCRSDPVGDEERVVSISTTGRPSTAKTTTGTCP